MEVELVPDQSYHLTSGHKGVLGLQSSAPCPTVYIGAPEVEGRTGPGGGPQVVRVQVDGPDGRTSTVHVRARVNDRGQIEFELSGTGTGIRPGGVEEGRRRVRRSLVSHWQL